MPSPPPSAPPSSSPPPSPPESTNKNRSGGAGGRGGGDEGEIRNNDMSGSVGSSCGDSSNVCVSIPVSSTESEKSVTNCIVSPGGMKYFMPSSVDGSQVPFQNQSFDSLDKAYNFYREYGRLGGFDVRKTTEKRDADGTIILKHFVCSKEGFVDGSHSEGIRQRRTVSRRCGCKVKVVMKIRSQNRYYIFNFVELHNHPLASESGRQFLRSSREMTVSLRNFVFDAAKVNIGCSKAFSLVKEMTGGYSNVGATLRDFRNFNRDLKEFVGERDGQMLIDKFKVLQETSKSFYFAYELDGDGYNMIFAPFTGVDKHDRCVTFAACLLSKEDVAHYNWAFKHFVKAMGRNNDLVASKHRLCMWHIMQKFPIKLGNRLCKETDFMEKMKTYIWSSNLEIDEFESGWKAVIGEFKLEHNKWLSDMYDIRKSWIPAYFRDSPMFGLMRTTSRFESENFFFSQFHKQGSGMKQNV
ncbi:protein FAR1-RELATED SEQUENCE 5-like [Daucus carota subsp. sativus]|uniref:protein FAR1-RELATED SEQUENCE 5-like n=1 Tax=Daucus carota subsp. sativus TaxID=79200 RepID=UPI003083B093